MINDLMIDPGDPIHYTTSFRRVIEDHLEWLKTLPKTSVIPVDPMQAHKYEFDAAGLYNELGIPAYLHWVVSRINGFTSLTQVPSTLTQVMVPATEDIGRLAATHSTSLRL